MSSNVRFLVFEPNIQGYLRADCFSLGPTFTYANGAFNLLENNFVSTPPSATKVETYYNYATSFYASSSNSIYSSANNTVQPKALNIQYLIKY